MSQRSGRGTPGAPGGSMPVYGPARATWWPDGIADDDSRGRARMGEEFAQQNATSFAAAARAAVRGKQPAYEEPEQPQEPQGFNFALPGQRQPDRDGAGPSKLGSSARRAQQKIKKKIEEMTFNPKVKMIPTLASKTQQSNKWLVRFEPTIIPSGH